MELFSVCDLVFTRGFLFGQPFFSDLSKEKSPRCFRNGTYIVKLSFVFSGTFAKM